MEPKIGLKAYLRVILKHYKFILLGTLLASLAAFMFKAFVNPPSYRATAAVLITQTHSRISFDPRFQTVEESDLLARNYVQTQNAHRASLVALVKSGAIARDVAAELGEELTEEERDPANLLGRVSASAAEERPGVSADANIVQIKVTAHDPALAARIANRWAETYVSHINELYGQPPEAYDSVQRQLLAGQQTYRESQDALEAFLLDSPIDLLRSKIEDTEHLIEKQMGDRQMVLSGLYSNKRRMQRLLDDAAALHDQVQTSGAQGSSTVSLAILMLKTEVFSGSDDLPTELQLQVQVLGDNADVDAQKADLAILTEVIGARILRLESAIEEALSMPLPEGVEELQEHLRQLRSDAEGESAARRELVSSRDLAWETYSTLLTKAAELGVAAETEDVEVVFASPAVAPRAPLGRGVWFSVALGAVMGCALCVLALFSFYYIVDDEALLPATRP